uniref:Mitogen-activated protein kinase kinase kinase 1-like n=2 Tax=Hirondellea gigas TaxID=1518452 RepID=A0A6A7FYB0_9CRUS
MMDASSVMFRGRLRKRGCEGVTKKGPLVAKHPSPPAPSPTSTGGSSSPTGSPTLSPHHNTASHREVRSPVGGVAPPPLRRKGSSPDPRGSRIPSAAAVTPTRDSPHHSPIGSPPSSPKCSPVRINDESGLPRSAPPARSNAPTPPSRSRPRPLSPHGRRITPPASPRSGRSSCNRPSSPLTAAMATPTSNVTVRTPTTPTASSRGIMKPRTQPRSHSPLTPTESNAIGFPIRADSPSSGIPRRIPFPSHRGTSPNNGAVSNGAGPLSRGISPSGGTSIPVIRNNNIVRGTSPNCGGVRGVSPTSGSTNSRENGRSIIYRGSTASRGTSPSSGMNTGIPRGVSPNEGGSNVMRGVSPSVSYRGTSPNSASNNGLISNAPGTSSAQPSNYRGTSPNGGGGVGTNYRGYSPNGSQIRRASPSSGNTNTNIGGGNNHNLQHQMGRDGSPGNVTPATTRGSSPNGGGSNPRGASPGALSTSTRGTSPNGSNIRGASPTGASFRGTSPGSRCSSSSGGVSEEVVRGRVRRAVRARLYLLHQPGPNSFSVGGDSPTHKFKVIIGPQSCSCGHGPYCVHVLFVMVRVLQVPETSPVLMSGTLKDYEVEQLLGAWEERRKKAVRGREHRTTDPSASTVGDASSNPSAPHSDPSGNDAASATTPGGVPSSPSREGGSSSGGAGAGPKSARGGTLAGSAGSSSRRGSVSGSAGAGAAAIVQPDDGSGEEDEAQCPICLTVMVEGESLVACESGCRNLLHHHCMAVWAADRHSQALPLLCPLCRAPWPAKTNPRLLVEGVGAIGGNDGGGSSSGLPYGSREHGYGISGNGIFYPLGGEGGQYPSDPSAAASAGAFGSPPHVSGSPLPSAFSRESHFPSRSPITNNYNSSMGDSVNNMGGMGTNPRLLSMADNMTGGNSSRFGSGGPDFSLQQQQQPHDGGGVRYYNQLHHVLGGEGAAGGAMNESGYGSVVGLAYNGNYAPNAGFVNNNGNGGNHSGGGGGSTSGLINNAAINVNNSNVRDVNSISGGSNVNNNTSSASNINHNYQHNNARSSYGIGNMPIFLPSRQQFPVYSNNVSSSSNNNSPQNNYSSNNHYHNQYSNNNSSNNNVGPSSSRPSLSSRHLSQQQQQQHHNSGNSSSHHNNNSNNSHQYQQAMSVPVIRPSATPSSPGRARRHGYPPGMSASFSGSGSNGSRAGGGAAFSNKSSMPRSQSQNNTNLTSSHQSPFADSAYSSPLLPNMGGFGSSSRNARTPPGGSSSSSFGGNNNSRRPTSKRSSSNSRIPSTSNNNLHSPNGGSHSNPSNIAYRGMRHHIGSSNNNNHHHNSNNPLPSASQTPLGMPPHSIGTGGLPGYYPPTLRGEVSAAMVADVGDDVPLPRSEPIPVEHEESASAWVDVFGRELVACLFSKDSAVRETGLRRLALEVVKVLHWDQLVTGEETLKKVVHCCANILAQVVNDPVYKVYLACLRVVRMLLSHLTLSVPDEVCWLQELLRPLLHTLLLKCADGNRRTSQISVDSLLELSRGQEGELALGGGQGLSLGGVQYVLSCILDEAPPQEAPWQWLLGRLCVLDRLLDQFPEQFQIQMVSLQPLESGYKLQHYDRLMTVVEFAFKALGSSHATVAKFARRVYICGAKMAAAEPNVFRHVCDMLGKLDLSLQMRLKRRLRSLQGQSSRPSFGRLTDNHPMHKPRSQIEASLRPYISTALPRLVRSVSHSPSRLLSAARSPSPSPAREPAEQNQPTTNNIEEPPQQESSEQQTQPNSSEAASTNINTAQDTNAVVNDDSNSNAQATATIGSEASATSQLAETAVKQSLARPTHLPLDSLHMKFKDKQARVRQYHRSRLRQEEPIIVQHALITPKPYKQKSSASSRQNSSSNSSNSSRQNDSSRSKNTPAAAAPLRKGGLSQSTGNNLDLSPRTPIGPPLPNFTFKDAVASPTTPNAPSTTPVKEVTHPILSAKLQSDVDNLDSGTAVESDGREYVEQPLPRIPNLALMPPYLEQDVGSSQERLAEEGQNMYEESNEWVRGQLLGSGAFSCCYQARDIATGTLMAVKLVSFVRNTSEEQERVEAAVEDEILLMSQLRHKNIVRLMGSVRHATSFCVFTEWMAGGSVSAMLERYGPFSEAVIMRYIKQVLHGLDYLHDNMILHRDLKGANLLIDSTGDWLRIGDFGTAARLCSKSTVTGEFQGQLLGTIAFMAPEVLRGDDYGRACDIWSIGCCIIEMATTKPPWDADHVSNQYKLMFKIATSNGPPIVPETLSDEARTMALLCLQTASEDRPTAKQLLKHPALTARPPPVAVDNTNRQT